MLENGRGLIKALENWAKKVTTGYKDVDVRDLSKSFRDGLAFCAIIHSYRPDLIDFDSLSKENIFENNSMAFSVAEKQLGVPALLDAEDMVKYVHPDRLSIITYLSQLRNCFENQNKVNKRPDLKRIQKNSSGPPAKVPVVEPLLRRHEVCQICNHRVFILERLMVAGKLYHTTCFRCNKCNNLLNPGAYVDSDTPGQYECSVCPKDEARDNTESDSEENSDKPLKTNDNNDAVLQVSRPVTTPVKEFASKEAVSFVRSNLSEDSAKHEKSSPHLNSLRNYRPRLEIEDDEIKGSHTSISVKEKINAFEKNQANEKTPPPSTPPPSPPKVVTPVPKLRHSLLSSTNKESENSDFQNRYSLRHSLLSAKSPEKSDKEAENESSLPQDSLTKSLTPPEVVEKNVSDKFVKDLSEEASKDIQDSFTDAYDSLSKVPNVNSDVSSSENRIFSLRSGSESPRVSRDIFKSSLPPLKLTLLPSARKALPTSPASDSDRIFSGSQMRSPFTSSTIGRIRLPSEMKESFSESNLNEDVDSSNQEKNTRRSSFESSSETGKESGSNSALGTTKLNSFHRTNSFGNELGVCPASEAKRTGLKSYTPIYKSLYNISNTSSSTLPKINSNSSLPSSVLSGSKLENGKDSDQSSDSAGNLSLKAEVSECNSISSIEENRTLEKVSVPSVDYKACVKDSKEEVEYPDDLNPFGDDEIEVEYPDDLNPFGDDEEETTIQNISKIVIEDYDESKNPFASDDDETTGISSYSPKPSYISPNLNDSMYSNVSSPPGSLKGTMKKRQAPKPPKLSDIFPKDSADSGIDSSLSSTKASPSVSRKNFLASSPKVRKTKPAPPPPPVSPSGRDPAAHVKMSKETDNMKLKSSATDDKPQPKQYKKKKRPAPSVPVSVRKDMKKMPLREIIQEMKEIEEKQREYERQGRDIEILIRDRDKDEEPSVEEEEYIMQLFELVNQKNALFRRQAELMYIKRSQRLEEQQYQVEKEIRQLMEKPDSEKTEEDRQKEEDLTMELIDIVDQRNSIIDSIEMDRRRELEEDHSVQEQIEIKNGDIPITAEIKQKSSKSKKNKDKKKEKKEKKLEDESGKGTLKKRKNLFKRH